MRIGFVDLETTALDADWGQLLCGSMGEYAPLTSQRKIPITNIRTFVLKDFKGKRWDDRSLAQQLIKEISKFDIVVTWNGIKFDEVFLATRLRINGLKSKRWPRHKDLLYTARYKLKNSTNRLAHISEVLDIKRKYGIDKTELKRLVWRKAIMGDARSYQYVITHCEHDVKVLAAVWEELKDLVGEIK